MNFVRYIQRRSLLRLGILITGVLLIIFAILSFFGQNVGNFVISVVDDDYFRGLVLSDSKDLTTTSSRLLANPAFDVRDITYDWLKIDKAINTDGDYHDPDFSYLAYTFYLVNSNEVTEDYAESMNVLINLSITSSKNNVDKAVRVLVIENETSYKLYMAKDEVETHYSYNNGSITPQVNYFLDDTAIMKQRIDNLRPGQVNKYTILMWLEGEDYDCTRAIQKGMIKMNMSFGIEKIDANTNNEG